MYSIIGILVENEMKVLKGKYFPACYIKVNYPRILVDIMPVEHCCYLRACIVNRMGNVFSLRL
jgi:hypothetical protein